MVLREPNLNSTDLVGVSLKRAGLWEEVKDRLHESGTGLSGGQQQRLCIARAIAVNPEIILMDEPCSALDPIATAKIEELIDELRKNYTIIIVTHSMQQAARVSQRTAFFHLGELVEEGPTEEMFTSRTISAPRTTSPAASAEGRTEDHGMTDHIAKAFDVDLQDLARMVAEMGGLAEKQIADSVDALAQARRPAGAQRSIAARSDHRRAPARDRGAAVLTIARRQPMAVDLREIVGALRVANDLERIGDLAKNIAKRVHGARRRIPSAQGDPRRQAHGGPGAGAAQGRARRLRARATSRGDRGVAAATRRSTRSYNSLFRELLTYMMEDPRNITFCTHLLFCAKNIERMGDHATNIAETVYYIVRAAR